MYNTNFNGAPMTYYSYGVPRPQARNTQPLTPDQIAKLRNNSNAFNMKVEEEDLWKAACTHKEHSGVSSLIDNQDGTFTCSICHETFPFVDYSVEQVTEKIEEVIAMMQVCKTLYLDIPEELARQFFQTIALLRKFPQLYKQAVQNFAKYDTQGYNGINPMGPGYSGFTAINNLLSNPYSGYGYAYPQQPGYPQPGFPAQQPMPQAPMPTQAPMPNFYGNGYMDPAMNMGYNPMAYGQPTAPMPQAPMSTQAPAPGVMPQAQVPVPAATSAQPQTEVQQQQVFNV